MENGSVPDAYAVSGDKLKQSVIESFLENDILRGGEEIDYYYSSNLFSFLVPFFFFFVFFLFFVFYRNKKLILD